ncbi:hypothetical protein GCM10022243_44910 [Saccharothrix violaceirubra]|uniref:DNA-binding CsgD family transcriptional regulator n=1 Tax=Saccharothrix violaceirubra TaxID=413306 RepID=A0A7W7T3E5_9PSEU|nr:LuxR family transcriptional regulator [Saccharothrix violaceirubra]MBB4964620.1 DNA-binding CsgD family transcriptional regulator [Saccharothrix violaceirubra]
MSHSHGREREWTSVLRLLSAPGGVLTLDGPPCSGKTRLLHDAVDAARDRGLPVVLVGGDHLAASADVAAVLDSRALVAVDQAHVDPAALLDLLDRVHGRPVAVLLTLTLPLAGAEVRRAVSTQGDVVSLGPVDAAAVRRLVVDLLGVPPGPDLLALVATAGGNPRLVADLVTGLREEGQLEVDATGARLRGGWLPRRVGTLVRARCDRLSARANQVLRVAAVLGRTFPLHDVATLMGETAAALLPAVDEVLASGLVESVDDRLEFSCDLVWRAVVESIPESVARALRHDAAVLRPAQPPVAVTGERGQAAVDGVRALAANGRLGSAIALARAGLSGRLPGPEAAELHVVLGGILLADGRPADAVAEMEHALAEGDVPEPVRRLASAGRLLALYFAAGDPAGAHALSVLTVRDREASDADVVMAATVHSCLEWTAGNLAEAMYWGRESTRWDLDGPTAWWQSHAAVAYALKLAALGEFDAAERLVRGDGPDTDSAVRSGAPAARLVARARVLTQAGDLVRADEAARAGLALARDRGLRLLVPLASTVLATVALHRGDLTGAAEHVRCYRGDLAAGEALLHSGQYDWVELLLTHARGGPGAAAESARALLDDPDGARRMLVEEPGAAAWLVRVALDVGDSALAEVAAHTAEDLAAANPGFGRLGAAAGHARALLDRDVDGLRSVVDRHRHPWASAHANGDVARLLAELGREDRAHGYRERAARIFERMGAEAELARLPGAAPPADSGTESADWRRLSEPERDIARLVGAGLTNRQVGKQLFLSPHTVNYHLRGIFRKLGISSRVELARLAHSQESPV